MAEGGRDTGSRARGGGTASEAIGKTGYAKAKGRLEEKPGRQALNRRTLILPPREYAIWSLRSDLYLFLIQDHSIFTPF
jgi:hypothetical protein